MERIATTGPRGFWGKSFQLAIKTLLAVFAVEASAGREGYSATRLHLLEKGYRAQAEN